ncbi:MAG: 3-hydroxyacyl-CoA dehydrogenase NAD-binding domain-containing protein [bacterium]|nr:3-hydroxyacyl-CoA dehydrogenase NAD-binding domain-containing protein [bacterium]
MVTQHSVIGVIGSGAMGSGIAQVAARANHKVIVYDSNEEALKRSESQLKATLLKLVEKQKITVSEQNSIVTNIQFSKSLASFSECELIIEAIVENLEVKQKLFGELENICSSTCLLASNTSSLSITSIAAVCKFPARVLGIHFFNPATLMPLVEIIPGIATDPAHAPACKTLIDSWGKVTVVAKDTPGFIVNRVARPFYSEALRIYEEGIADIATIDWAMKEIGGFKMGPFELMDMIGHDVNYVVTETVWKQFYYDPKFKPALSQKRLLEAGFLGKKSGQGFYSYAEGAKLPEATKDPHLGNTIFTRILVMLINEAADSLYLGVASAADIDLAMTKGVNYPKGLLQWADDFGISHVIRELTALNDFYAEDRYRISPLLKQKFINNAHFTR